MLPFCGYYIRTPERKSLPRIAKSKKHNRPRDMVSLSDREFEYMIQSNLINPRDRTVFPADYFFPPVPPSPPFRFLDLPAEIRTAIYVFRFFDESFVVRYEAESWLDDSYLSKKWRSERFCHSDKPQHLVALLQTCRQCYQEATVVFNHYVEYLLDTPVFHVARGKRPERVPFERLPTVLVSRVHLQLNGLWKDDLPLVLPTIINSAPRAQVLTVKAGLKSTIHFSRIGVTREDVFRSVTLQQKIFGDILAGAEHGEEAQIIIGYARKHRAAVKLRFIVWLTVWEDGRFQYYDPVLDIDAEVLKVCMDGHTFEVPQNPRVRAGAEA